MKGFRNAFGLGAATFLLFLVLCSAFGDEARPPRNQAIRTNVNEVFSNPDFAPLRHRNTAMEDLGKNISDWLGRLSEWLQRLFRVGKPGRSHAPSYLLYPLVAVLLIGIAYLAAYTLAKSGGKKERKSAKKGPTVDLSALESADSRDSDEWLEAAHHLAGKGDFLRAFRAVFVATLLKLDAAGVVTYEQFRTNGEYLRATRKVPSFHPQFRAMVHSFDAGWYGEVPVSEAEYRQGLEGYRQAQSLTSQNGAN